jgi:hypothetical protein
LEPEEPAIDVDGFRIDEVYMKLLDRRCMFYMDFFAFVAFVTSKLCKTCRTNKVVEHLTVWAHASL